MLIVLTLHNQKSYGGLNPINVDQVEGFPFFEMCGRICKSPIDRYIVAMDVTIFVEIKPSRYTRNVSRALGEQGRFTLLLRWL